MIARARRRPPSGDRLHRARGLSALAASLAAFAFVPPVRACDTGPFRLFYGSGSDRLSQEDRGLLSYMKDLASTDGFIRLSGHSDTSGPAGANLHLSRRRVDGARAFLVSLGMPAARILTHSLGEGHSGTALDDGIRSARHRYVLVEILPAAEARKGRAGRHGATCGG